MFNIKKKYYYTIQKINTKLKKIEKCLINKQNLKEDTKLNIIYSY